MWLTILIAYLMIGFLMWNLHVFFVSLLTRISEDELKIRFEESKSDCSVTFEEFKLELTKASKASSWRFAVVHMIFWPRIVWLSFHRRK